MPSQPCVAKTPNDVPFVLGMTAPVYDLFHEKTGAYNPAEYWDFDVRGTYFRSPSEKSDHSPYLPDDLPEGTEIDDWGIANVPGSMFHFTKMVHPLRDASTVDDINRYPLPNYTRQECWQPIEFGGCRTSPARLRSIRFPGDDHF